MYYVADDREGRLQRAALAAEIARLLGGFADVSYPDWDALLTRWWRDAPPGAALALDEFPSLVSSAPELPSLLQKHLDQPPNRRPHLVLAGSSQRMMQGLVLDRSAPLFGRAREILKVEPLGAGWIKRALGIRDDIGAVEAYAVWGGVPRYWELARDHHSTGEAIEALVLDPLGVLHDEPRALLLDDLRDLTQAQSILTLIGAGAHRLSEIAGRLGKPATSLARPLARLNDLGLVRRDVPFGALLKDGKRSAYRIADPFLRLWFAFVEPNRSRLQARLISEVRRQVMQGLSRHVSGIWEDMVRESVPRARYFGKSWGPAAAWWGPGQDGLPMEVDVVAQSSDGRELLVGEAKWQEHLDWRREVAALQEKTVRLPLARGKRVRLAIWAKRGAPVGSAGIGRFTPRDVLRALV